MWFNGLRCCDCDNLDKYDKNKYGEAYCPTRREYVALDSYTCRDFVPNFYIMTAYCNINKLPYECEMMTKLISFRDTYMINNEKGIEFLKEYEGLGPELAARLTCDMYRTDIVISMKENYINPAIDFINVGRYEEAQETYIQMIESLKIRYGYSQIEKGKRKDFKF